MTKRSTTYLKGRWETNDIPSQTDYEDLIDSFVNLEATAAQSMAGSLSGPSFLGDILQASAYTVHALASVSAAGTTQASATRLQRDVHIVYTNNDDRSVVLAAATPGRTQWITNTNTTVLRVFPASGGNFIGTAENAAILLAANSSMIVAHLTTSAYAIVRT